MKQVLFIRPDTEEGGKIWWCESGSEQVASLDGNDALESLAGHRLAARVCLLLPASELIFRHFTLPKKGMASQAAAFSWMAEETLLGDVDNLHWTVLHKKGCEVDAVAVDIDRLRQRIDRLRDAGLKVIQALPDAWLLPIAQGGSTLVSLDDIYWLRFSPLGAGNVEADLLPLLMAKAGEGEVCCYGDAPAHVSVDETLAWRHPLQLIQPQWQGCKVNMLHGEFSASGAKGGASKGVKAAIVAAGILCVGMLLGPRLAMAWMLTQQENEVQQDIVQLYQHHFPSLRQQTNIKYHFGQNMKKQRKALFLQMDDLEAAKQAVPAMEITRVEYDDVQGVYTLSVDGQSPQALQEFINQASAKFDFSLQPLSNEAPYTAMVTGKYR